MKASTAWLPMKPAPPVTTASGFISRRVQFLQGTDVVVTVDRHAVRDFALQEFRNQIAYRIFDGTLRRKTQDPLNLVGIDMVAADIDRRLRRGFDLGILRYRLLDDLLHQLGNVLDHHFLEPSTEDSRSGKEWAR